MDLTVSAPGERFEAGHGIGDDLPRGADLAQLVGGLLDHFDYGVILVDGDLGVHHVNRVASRHLAACTDLRVSGGRIELRPAAQAAALNKALQAALLRGLRSTLALEAGRGLAVAPALRGPSPTPLVALVLSRTRICTRLAAEAFARDHGLTSAETAVLHALAGGEPARQIARRHGVALSTVRTQLSSIRAKTRAASIVDLVHRLACVPPVVGLLGD